MAKVKTGIRFAALIRVSTEKQEKQGESLRTQESQLTEAVQQLGGSIVKRYAGQEHATAGYERKQVEQLLADAARKPRPFDAVIVADPTRWSRDNLKSETGLERLRDCGVKFFVLNNESDLFNPRDRFMLSLSTSIGALHAGEQKKKSIENRIHRAERNFPTSGKLPFGRTFDKKTAKWGVDDERQALILDVATRYLAGEPLAKLAEEYGQNHSNLHKVLMHRCGDTWEQEFHSDDLNIHKVVTVTIPPLLPPKVIKAMHRKADANRTFLRGQIKYRYLFKSLIFCGHCGKTMGGQMNHGNRRYYRHHSRSQCERAGTKAWVVADELEAVVMRHLFQCFGNAKAVQRAIDEATPNRDQLNGLMERAKRLEAMLAKTRKAKDRIIQRIGADQITDEEADKELTKLRQKEAHHQKEIDAIREQLDALPTPQSVKAFSQQVSKRVRASARLKATKTRLNMSFDQMTWEDQRALVEMVFSGRAADGKRMGVYIYWLDGNTERRKRWKYTVVGHLINEVGYVPMSKSRMEAVFESSGNPVLPERLGSVTQSTLYLRDKAPLAPRSASPPPRPPA